VSLPISRHDTADFLVLSVETVSRALTSLKERGIVILMGPRRVEIVEREVLAGGDFKVQPNVSCFAWLASQTSRAGVKGAATRGA
jgi:Crp-like helix-turn-helix domain